MIATEDEKSLESALPPGKAEVSEGGPVLASLVELIGLQARVAPDVQALVFTDGRRTSDAFTFRQLWERSLAAAAELAAAGVRRGDRVLLILPTAPAFPFAFFGAQMLGATCVPMAPPYSVASLQLEAYSEALARVVRDCEPRVCVTIARLSGLLHGCLGPAAPKMLALSAEGAALSEDAVQPLVRSDVAMIQYTSGSTSEPKGVVLTHGNLLANVSAIASALQVTPADVGVSWLPLYHDMGLIGAMLTALKVGRPVVLIPPQDFVKDPLCWLRMVSVHRGTITIAPNFAFGFCAKSASPEQVAALDLSSLRVVMNGAEPIDVKLIERFEETFRPAGLRPQVVKPVYGLAESTLAVSFHTEGPFHSVRVDADLLEREGRVQVVGAGARTQLFVSVGRPIATQEVRVVNPRGRRVADGSVGEIIVRGPSVMTGYFKMPQATVETLKQGFLYTGDYGFVLDGRLYITGRKKDLIIRRGRNYHPQDFEFQASKIEGVRKGSVAVFSTGEGEDVELVVVVESKIKAAAQRAEISRKIVERLSHTFAFAPQQVLVVDPGTIPKTTSGKLRRSECRRRYLAGTLGARGKVPGWQVVRLWARTALGYLGVQKE